MPVDFDDVTPSRRVSSESEQESLSGARPWLPPRVRTLLTGPGGRRIAVALLGLVVIGAVVAVVVVRHHHQQREAAAASRSAAAHRRAAAAAQELAVARKAQAARNRVARRVASLDEVRTWSLADVPYSVQTLPTSRTPGCKDIDAQAAHPPQERVRAELLAAFPHAVVRTEARTVDESGWLCLLQVSVNVDHTVVLLRIDPTLRHTLPSTADRSGPGADAVGYLAETTRTGWTTVLAWHGRTAPSPATQRRLVDHEAPRW